MCALAVVKQLKFSGGFGRSMLHCEQGACQRSAALPLPSASGGRRLALARGGDAHVDNGDSDAFRASGQCCFHYIQHHKKEITAQATKLSGYSL